MTRSLLRLPHAEICAVLGIGFGVWLIHNTFQPTGDTPNFVLLAIGALDIHLCFLLLAFLLRARLRDGEPLPRSWIVAGTMLIACFLGWIAALFLDSDRLLKEQKQHGEYVQDLVKLEDSLHHLKAALPTEDFSVNARAWKENHDLYVHALGLVQVPLRANPVWDKELTRVDAEVQEMQKLFTLVVAERDPLHPDAPAQWRGETWIGERGKWRTEFQAARKRAVEQAQSLRGEIAKAEGDLAATHRARWHAVGASALTGVVLLLGCLLFWLLFDRELRRSWKAQARLSANEARFRWLVENQSEPIAVLDAAGNILYVNPVWQTAFGYELDELQSSNLLELIRPEDRPRVQAALLANDVQHAIPCHLSADYGVRHDVELHCQPHDDAGTSVVRVHDLRETPDVPMQPQPELLNDEKLKTAEARLAELEKERDTLRESEAKARGELDHHRWLLESHTQANSEGVLILSARGEALSWNPSFVRLWKLSDDTISAHTWQTVAAHMESQVEAGWKDFQRAAAPGTSRTDTCWEMTLEGGRTFEVYAQTLRDDPQHPGAGQFHFRDVTRHTDLQAQLREHREQLSEHEDTKKAYEKQMREHREQLDEHEENKQSYEANLREHEKRLKQLEKQLRERDQHHEELEGTLRDHQDRLHQMHETHESHEAALKASKEATRRLASGVANDFNNVLSAVIGNTEVLRDNLPRDHVAQNYLDEIHQAASRGTELSQRLVAFSRNHLLQMAPIEMNQQLTALEPKLRVALGHVQLQWQRAEQELWVKTDAHPLEQALIHLVAHAKTHMPNGGTLTIRTARVQLTRSDLTHADMAPGPYIQLRLTDTGAGIDDDNVSHVFEPYHSVVEGQKGDLTLATAYGILRQSGGCIDVTSEKGKGTEWTLLLPETKERPQEAALRASA